MIILSVVFAKKITPCDREHVFSYLILLMLIMDFVNLNIIFIIKERLNQMVVLHLTLIQIIITIISWKTSGVLINNQKL